MRPPLSRRHRPLLLIAVLALSPSLARSASKPTLGVGDPPPPLVVSRWLRGEPVRRFEPGRTYVVESWATWCQPCLESMPRLSEIQRRHAGRLSVIGVSIWEADASKVPGFVERMADRMQYAVATDSVPVGSDGFGGRFAKQWIEGANMYSHGVPLAYVVDGRGRIAWIGHPSSLDSVVDAVVAGSWNLDAARRRWQEDRAAEAQSEPLLVAYYGAMRANDPAAKRRACEALVGLDPARFGQYALTAFQTVRGDLHDPAAADSLARRWRREYADHPAVLRALARGVLLDPQLREDPASLAFALDCAGRANQLEGGTQVETLRALSSCQRRLGDLPAAIQSLERASSLATGEQKAEIDRALEQLRAAK